MWKTERVPPIWFLFHTTRFKLGWDFRTTNWRHTTPFLVPLKRDWKVSILPLQFQCNFPSEIKSPKCSNHHLIFAASSTFLPPLRDRQFYKFIKRSIIEICCSGGDSQCTGLRRKTSSVSTYIKWCLYFVQYPVNVSH